MFKRFIYLERPSLSGNEVRPGGTAATASSLAELLLVAFYCLLAGRSGNSKSVPNSWLKSA
jgi:hypothetical protein